jgi:hypothetical protein
MPGSRMALVGCATGAGGGWLVAGGSGPGGQAGPPTSQPAVPTAPADRPEDDHVQRHVRPRERSARCAPLLSVQRRCAFTIQARESNQTPFPAACAPRASRRRPSARSADAVPSPASASCVDVKPRTHSSAAPTS